VGDLVVLNRALRRLQRLRDHLTAEHATDPAGLARAAEQVGVDPLDVEQRDEFGDEFVRCAVRIVPHRAPVPALRASGQYPLWRASRSA
jgi:hypothetical protein